MPATAGDLWGNLFLLVLLTYTVAAILSALCYRFPRPAGYLGHGLAALAAAGGVILSWGLLTARGTWSAPLPWNWPLGSPTLQVDGLSAFFVMVISLLALAVSVFSLGYVREYDGKVNQGFLAAAYNLFILSMLLVVTAGDAFLFLVVWELMALVSFLLVTAEHAHAPVGRPGFIYLVMTHLGTGLIMLSFLVFYRFSGDFSFASFAAAGTAMPGAWQSAAFVLALIGFGTKAGLVPLHIWLPQAHPAAPSHVSALMSGVMIKTAVYGLARVAFTFLGAHLLWWGVVVLLAGTVSALLGVMYALMEHDLKRLLAYHSVENIGIILMGMGAAMVFTATGQPALAVAGMVASLYHLINHAVFKGLLFLGAGAVVSVAHTRDMEKMGGLIRGMPWTAAFFLAGSVSIAALPPFNGFISEWLTFQSLLNGFRVPGAVTILAPVAGAALALTGALAAACFVKAFGVCFLAQPRSEAARSAREVSGTMLGGMGFLALMCLALGVFPALVISRLSPVAVGLVGQVNGIPGADAPMLAGTSLVAGLGSLSPAALAAALLALALLALAAGRVLGSRAPRRTGETWACGIPYLEPVMGYTATAFSQPIRQIFRGVFQPTQEVKASYDGWPYFPKAIRYHGHIRPLFEDYLYRPVLQWLLAFSAKVRGFQAGSIHLYLVYILITLVLLLSFAI